MSQLKYWDGTAWVDAIVGAQGIQGIQGTQGIQGIQGDTGVQGTQGTQGIQGTQGVQGTQGIQGETGTQGTQGEQGIQGTQGIQGIQGPQGTQGTQGIQGIQGLIGDEGIVFQTTAPDNTEILWLDTDDPADSPATISVTSPIVNTGTATDANIGIDLSNIAAKYANPFQISYRSGYWYESRNGATLSNASATLNRLYVYPVFIKESITIDRLGIEVQTQAAASTIRLGIYNSDSNGEPSTLVIDAGTVSGTTTGLKAITVSQTLSAGLYYFAWVWNGATGRTITYGTTANTGNWAPVASTTQGPTSSYFGQYLYPGDSTTGSLPLTWSGNSPTAAAATRIQFRVT